MTRKEAVNGLKKYFSVKELVCPHILGRFNGREDTALDFLDKNLIEVMLWIRRSIGRPITVNSDALGFTQRGMRCNMCEIVRSKTQAYLSSHLLGSGVDFDVEGMTAEEVRRWIVANKESLPHAIRLERGVCWVHLDVRNETDEMILWFDQ